MAGLTALHTLVLDCFKIKPGSFDALEGLPRLRRLHPSSHVFPNLSRLTGLEELVLTDPEDQDALDTVLRGLTCLTTL